MRKRWAGWTIVFICWNLAGLLMDRAWVLSPSVWCVVCVGVASVLFTAGCEMLLSVVCEETSKTASTGSCLCIVGCSVNGACPQHGETTVRWEQ